MLRITADVNGKAIGYIYIHNTGRHQGDVWLYDAASWNPDRPLASVFGIEGVRHDRTLGWTQLAMSVMRNESLQ